MKNEELQIDYDYYDNEQCSFDDLKQATAMLTVATQGQFEEIKNEKWFNRVFDMVTFSKKNEIRMANQIGNVSQAQQILMEILIRLSTRDSEISDLVAESFEKIEYLSNQDILLAKKLKQLENSLLGISKQTDINELSEIESHILGGLFYYLVNNFDVISDQQRAYANAILTYLDVEAQKIDIKQSIDLINNIDKKRKILTCCMEYGYLNQFNFDYIDNIEEMIIDFDFGNKTITKIKEGIVATYNLRGVDGFIDKYDYDEAMEFDEVFSMEFEGEILEVSEDVAEEIEMTKIETNTILNIAQGETKIFKNNIIHFHSYINCAGNLIFENCIISYNVSETSDEISLGEGAKIKFNNCKIVCKNTDKSYFIQGTGNNEVTIESSDLINCSYFIETYSSKIFFNNCAIINPCVNFLNNWDGEGIISNCSISFSKIPEQNKRLILATESYDGIFNSTFTENFIIKGCMIYGDDEFKNNVKKIKEFFNVSQDEDQYEIRIFNIVNAIYENCSFINLASCIFDAQEVRNSMFKNCKRIIFDIGSSYEQREAKIIDCTFENCENIVSASGKVHISGCQFFKCKNKIISGGFNGPVSVEFCEFSNLISEYTENCMSGNAHLEFTRRDDKTSCCSSIKKCVFSGINLRGGLLIKGIVQGKPYREAVCVENSDFRNCFTSRKSGELTNEWGYYINLFKKKIDFKVVEIIDCKGLDKVNKANGYLEDATLKVSTSSGLPIGANLAANVGTTLDVDIDLNDEKEEVLRGDFEYISVTIPKIDGYILVNDQYSGNTPLGVNFEGLNYLANSDNKLRWELDCKFVNLESMVSEKGGLTNIVWMPNELKNSIGETLNRAAKEIFNIQNFTDMVCDETICVEPEALLEYLKVKGHPIFGVN